MHTILHHITVVHCMYHHLYKGIFRISFNLDQTGRVSSLLSCTMMEIVLFLKLDILETKRQDISCLSPNLLEVQN